MDRPKETIRKRTHDERFLVQRECALVAMRMLEEAPLTTACFGFDPHTTGGEVFAIRDLMPVKDGRHPLWLVQRRIAHRMLNVMAR